MTRKTRPYLFYDVARTLCSTCLRRCDGKLLIEFGRVAGSAGEDQRVVLEKWCPEHGRERVLVADDAVYWRRMREQFLKPPERPDHFQTPMKWGCPYDCGVCPDHQQHACVALVEINDKCNLTCPICYASSGVHRTEQRTLAEVERMLDGVVRAETRPDVVQISGGEPTIHPDLFAILDAAKARPIRHLMLNTNGVRLAAEPDFVRKLAAYQPGFEVYLQFDSLRDDALMTLRGARLSRVRQAALENLEAAGLSTTLVCTIQKGVNDDEIGEIIDFATRWRCVRGVTLQPIQAAGRVEGYDPELHRLTVTEVRRRIYEQSAHFTADDLVPVPCHPDSLVMGYALKLGDQIVPLTRYARQDQLLAGPENTIVLEEVPALKEAVVGLFSTGIGPELQAERLAELLCCMPRIDAPNLTYENVFRVLIVRFADASDFDLRSVKKCCIFFAQPDGRLVPFDTYNLLYRDPARLEALRAHPDALTPAATYLDHTGGGAGVPTQD